MEAHVQRKALPPLCVCEEGKMSTTTANLGHHAVAAESSRPAYQAYQILHFAFTAAPILAGIDKFFHLLTNWDQYLAPWIARMSPIGGHGLILVGGGVRNIAGIRVPGKPDIE